MSRLAHDGLLRPRDMVDAELGVGLVYRLTSVFSGSTSGLRTRASGSPSQISCRSCARSPRAVGYAHRNRVVHRGLTPQAVMGPPPGRRIAARSGRDWQSAGCGGESPAQTSLSSGVTGLLGLAEPGLPAQPVGATRSGPCAADADQRLAEAFQAPEGVWTPDADRIRLDVFALGALAYLRLAGRPAATDRASLRERLQLATTAWTWPPTCRRCRRRPGSGAGGDPAEGQRAAAATSVRSSARLADAEKALTARRRGGDRSAGGRPAR